MKDFNPICSGPCSRTGTMAVLSDALYDQFLQYMIIQRRIDDARLASLTPAIMRQELADLGRRIDAAREGGEK